MGLFSFLFSKKISGDNTVMQGVKRVGDGMVEIQHDLFMSGIKESISTMGDNIESPQWNSEPIKDERTPFCPYCGIHTDTLPGSRRRCKDCGMTFTVRTNSDRIRRVMTEEDAANMEILGILGMYFNISYIDEAKSMFERDSGKHIEYYDLGLLVLELVGDKMDMYARKGIIQTHAYLGINKVYGLKRADLQNIKKEGYHFVQIERGECSSLKRRISNKIEIKDELKKQSLPCKEGGPICLCKYIAASKIVAPLK